MQLRCLVGRGRQDNRVVRADLDPLDVRVLRDRTATHRLRGIGRLGQATSHVHIAGGVVVAIHRDHVGLSVSRYLSGSPRGVRCASEVELADVNLLTRGDRMRRRLLALGDRVTISVKRVTALVSD